MRSIVIILFSSFFLLSGCASRPVIFLSPKAPVGADTDGNKVIDARRPVDRSWNVDAGEVISASLTEPPHPPQSKIIGNYGHGVFVLSGPRTAADTVASIVAKKYPNAEVTLLDFRNRLAPGLVMQNVYVYISAKIASNGHSMTISSEAENPYWNTNNLNFSIAYERALEDFSQKIEAAPSDISKAVN